MDKQKSPGLLAVARALLILAGFLALLVQPGPVHAYGKIATRLVRLIHVDDSGLRLGMVSRVRYDPLHQETYVYSSNNRITIYDQDFFPQGSIGSGRGVGSVTGMAISPQGLLYLSQGQPGDLGRGVVVTIYDSALFVDRELVVAEIPGLAGFYIYDLAVSAAGEIYLAGYFPQADGTGQYRGVAVLDPSGNFMKWLDPRADLLRKAAPGGDSLERMSAPIAISHVEIDEQGRRYFLSTWLSEIFVYNDNDEYLFTFGVKGGADGKLSNPRTVAVDYPRRLLYVVDYMRHTILAYDYDSGRFVYEFGGKGVGPLWFLFPNDIAVDRHGMVIVADMFNRRVQVLDPTNPERPVISPRLPESIGVAPPLPAEGSGPSPAAERTPPSSLAALEDRALPAPAPARSVGVPALTIRELAARGVKKTVVAPPPQPDRLAAFTPPAAPAPPAVPEPAAAEPVVEPAPAAGGGAGGNVPRAVLGVYGPVAAMLGVGGWLLYRKGR